MGETEKGKSINISPRYEKTKASNVECGMSTVPLYSQMKVVFPAIAKN